MMAAKGLTARAESATVTIRCMSYLIKGNTKTRDRRSLNGPPDERGAQQRKLQEIVLIVSRCGPVVKALGDFGSIPLLWLSF